MVPPPMSVADALKQIESRVIDPAKIYRPPQLHPSLAAGNASNTVTGPASIAELARALKNDPDLIFQWVYNNVEHNPTFGESKGALGCLIDNNGCNFDQCELLFALFTAAGLSPSYVFGNIQLTAAQAGGWLGTDPTNIQYSYNLLASAGYPVQYANNNTEILLPYLWVQLAISGTTYVFDPSFKSYSTTAPINLATAMGYSQSTFITQSQVGATIDPSGNYVQNMNRSNLRSQLATSATNLVNWIKTNNPAARTSDIVGGRTINQITAPVRLTALPYEAPGDTTTIWTSIPDSYRSTVEILYGPVDVTLFGSDVHGQRLTLFYNTNAELELRLNGNLVAVATGQSGYSYQAAVYLSRPTTNYIGWDAWNAYYNAPSGTDLATFYLLGICLGPMGPGIIDYWQDQLAQNQASGAAPFSEPVMGSNLALLYFTRCAQRYANGKLLGGISSSTWIQEYDCGSAYFTAIPAAGPTGYGGFDLPAQSAYFGPLDGTSNDFPAYRASGLFDNGFEMLTMQQVTGTTAIATPAIIDIANSAGTKLYKITPDNKGTLVPLLTGYSSGELSNIDSDTTYYDILIPQSTPQLTGNPTAGGWATFASNANFGGNLTYGLTFSAGGSSTTPGTPWQGQPPAKNRTDPITKEPINFRTGAYNYERSDITVGSQDYPYSLEFRSRYDSRLMRVNGPLGLGWSHQWVVTATAGSDYLRSFGTESPIEAASTIAALYITTDLCGDDTQPVNKVAILELATDWWIDQLTGNAVTVHLPDGDSTFIKLVDGSFHPQAGDASTLTLTGGLYKHSTPQKIVSNFNSSGQLSTIVFPFGVTITLGYTSNRLTSISNGLSRSLTLAYTGNYLSSVTDGNGRTVNYSVNATSEMLTQISDTLGHATTFSYDIPGRLTQFFRPANPTTPYVTNTYDSLNRVKTQANALNQTWTYYFAGSRSEELDPLNNSRVAYFDTMGNVVREINALGLVTASTYDGLNRLTQQTMPEGNKIQWTYDVNNNVLTETSIAKPGSSLANVVKTYTYDPTWAKIKTFKDGRSNTTTYTYDPTFGTLLTVEKPVVGGVTPTTTYTYNARGQVISFVDETGIQSQNTYDGTSEKLTKSTLNTNWLATISGTVTAGNVLTITAHDALLSGGVESVSYTVATGNTLAQIATGLATAVNADSHLASVGIIAYSSGAVISLATAKGNATTFTASSTGTETIGLTAGLKLSTSYGYDAAGNANSIQDPNGNTTTSVYDTERRLTQVTAPSPFSYVSNFTYDYNGNPLTIQKQTGDTAHPYQITTWTYSVTDKKKTETDPASKETTWNYDGKDRLQNIIDPMLREYQYAYDALDRLHQITDPSGTISETKLYTNNGFLLSIKDARSNTTTYSYDGLDRLDKTTYADSSYEENQVYDANGNVLQQRARSGNLTVKTFDVLNRLSTKAPASQPTVTYQYDVAGRLISASKPVVSGDPSSGNFQKFYDTAGRFYKEQYPDGKLVTLVLDGNGNTTKITYPDGYYVTRVYDQLNRITDIKLNGSTTAAAHFAYDELSRRTTLTYSNGASVTYGYQSTIVDDLISIAHAFVGSNVTLTYGYNNAHQIDSLGVTDNTYMWHPAAATTATYATANVVNEYPTVSAATYTYNGNGCLSSDGTWTYSYDTENHLTAASKTGTSVSYLYDPVERQAQKTVGTIKSRYIYLDWQRIADYDGAAGTLQNRYVYGENVDEPLIQVTSAGVLTYYHANHQGSIIGVSNASGAIVNKNVIGPFGETSSLAGTTFGFTGQRYDSDTGLYYYKKRYYSPATGRYLQPDPMKYLDDLNLYNYVANDPLDNVDESGGEISGFSIDPHFFMPPRNPLKNGELTTPDCSQPDCGDPVSYPDGLPCEPDNSDTCVSYVPPCMSVDLPCPPEPKPDPK